MLKVANPFTILNQLIKVEEGLCDGEILYHKIVDKTPEEKLFIRQQRNLKKQVTKTV